MDGREAMSFSGGSASFYIHRGGGGGGGGGVGGSRTPTQPQPGGFQGPPGFRALSNVRGAGGPGPAASAFSPEPQHPNFGHGISIGSSSPGGGAGAGSGGGGGGGSGAPPSSSGEPVKKKRGRPRKYGPGGPVSLRLSATANSSPGSGTPLEKKRRGRPPGSGRKQQLASLGEWMNSSAGMAFSPHVISVEPGEDIVAKLLSFAQQRPRAVCIMSGTGIVSSVTMRQPASNTVSVTYEGRFQILCLSGSYLVADDGGARSRTGGISVSLSSPEGHVIGGGVAVLIAATPVQVVVCSFVYGGSSKAKPKQVTSTKDSGSEPQSSDKLASPASAPPPNQNYNSSSSAVAIWPGSQPADLKSAHPHTGIDLTRG
ncbi:AT-hook motif nuclear-localized protein [Arachis hypogaea]|nr:AT-hook motif nuclear-localized protein [Arachis hypogaea]